MTRYGEPWKHSRDDETIIDCNGDMVADSMYFLDPRFHHIVACVNACEGINPAAVPYLLAACKAAFESLQGWHAACMDPDDAGIIDLLYNAITSAEGVSP